MTDKCALVWAALLAVAFAAPARAGEQRTLRVGGLERTYVLHAPALWPGTALPLVLVLHGSHGNAADMEARSGFAEEADWRGFAVAYPEATPVSGRRWNAGVCCGDADDVAFLRAVVDDAAARLPIDRRRVFAAGVSNGGMMAYRLACEASESFAAVGVVAGALVTPGCAPAAPVSVIHLHGTRDELVPLTGGPGALGVTYPTTERSLDFWIERDGCDPTPRLGEPGPELTLRRYAGCRAGTSVEFYEVERGKHGWLSPPRRSRLLRPPPGKLDTTGVLWQFFAAHPKLE